MPNTIDYIENTGKYDVLEIFARGETPDQPINVYSAHNDERKEKIKLALEGKKYISKYARKFGYSGAKDAVLGAREEEYDRVIGTLQPRIKEVLDSMNKRNASKEEKEMVLNLMNEYQSKILKKKSKLGQMPNNGEYR